MYPDWELNLWPFGSQASTQSTELHQPEPTEYLQILHPQYYPLLNYRKEKLRELTWFDWSHAAFKRWSQNKPQLVDSQFLIPTLVYGLEWKHAEGNFLIKYFILQSVIKTELRALAGVAQWIEYGLWIQGSLVRFPVRVHAWVAGQVPSEGHVTGHHTLMFLSLVLPPSPDPEIHTYIHTYHFMGER